MVALVASNGWFLFQMDLHNAFLQGDLFEEVYMTLPPGFGSQGENKVCRLLKSLYGLKPASRQWNLKLTTALIQSGFTQSKLDYSLFTKKDTTGGMVIILVYVDDLLITGNNEVLIQEAKDILHHNFKMKNLGELRYFLGIEFARSKKGILMNERRYALELVAECGLSGGKVTTTPLEQNQKLTSLEYDKQFNLTNDAELDDRRVYQRLIGRLLYLAMTRPDISFAVQHLSQFMHAPKKSHYDAALHVVRYIKGQPGLGLLMSSKKTGKIDAFCNADWASCSLSRRSVTGFGIKFGESLISWRSKKQSTVSRSSAEAEYRSMATTVAELVWLQGLLQELGASVELPMELHCDNKAAMQIASNPMYHEQTKHIEIDCHFIRERQDGMVKTEYIASKDQMADIFTKALGKQLHSDMLFKLGMLDIFHHPT